MSVHGFDQHTGGRSISIAQRHPPGRGIIDRMFRIIIFTLVRTVQTQQRRRLVHRTELTAMPDRNILHTRDPSPLVDVHRQPFCPEIALRSQTRRMLNLCRLNRRHFPIGPDPDHHRLPRAHFHFRPLQKGGIAQWSRSLPLRLRHDGHRRIICRTVMHFHRQVIPAALQYPGPDVVEGVYFFFIGSYIDPRQLHGHQHTVRLRPGVPGIDKIADAATTLRIAKLYPLHTRTRKVAGSDMPRPVDSLRLRMLYTPDQIGIHPATRRAV